MTVLLSPIRDPQSLGPQSTTTFHQLVSYVVLCGGTVLVFRVPSEDAALGEAFLAVNSK